MHLLTVQPGASYSTADVYEGLIRELAMLGHEIRQYISMSVLQGLVPG